MNKKLMLLSAVVISVWQVQAVNDSPFAWIRDQYRQWWISKYLDKLDKLKMQKSPEFEETYIKYSYYLDQVADNMSDQQKNKLMKLSEYWEDLYESSTDADRTLRICKILYQQLKQGDQKSQSIIGLLEYIMKLDGMDGQGMLRPNQQKALECWKKTFRDYVERNPELQKDVRSFMFHASGGG